MDNITISDLSIYSVLPEYTLFFARQGLLYKKFKGYLKDAVRTNSTMSRLK